jgi:hypothetical protein
MSYSDHNIKLDWTIPVLTKLGNFVTEFDCKIEFACSEEGRGEWDWEVTEIEIEECSFHKRHFITKESDSFMWEVLMRGIKQDTEQLHERIVERIEEYAW